MVGMLAVYHIATVLICSSLVVCKRIVSRKESIVFIWRVVKFIITVWQINVYNDIRIYMFSLILHLPVMWLPDLWLPADKKVNFCFNFVM